MRRVFVFCCIVFMIHSAFLTAQDMDEHFPDDPDEVAESRDSELFLLPEAVSVIDSAITEANARNTADALSTGMHVGIRKANPAGGSPVVRGMSGKNVLVLVDGIRYTNALSSYDPGQYLNLIDSAMIDRIEIARGAGSVRYGADALGGVVNIITKKPSISDERGLYSALTSRYASQDNGAMNRIDLGGILGRMRYSGGITIHKIDDLEGGGDTGTQPYTGYDQTSWNADIISNFARGTVTVSGGESTQRDVYRADRYIYNDIVSLHDPRSYRFLRAAYDVSHPFRGLGSFHLAFSSTKQKDKRDQYDIDSTFHTINTDKTESRGLTAYGISTIAGKHTLTYGADYAADEVSSKAHTFDSSDSTAGSLRSSFPDGSTFTSWGVYTEDRIALSEKIALTAGLRWSDVRTESMLLNNEDYEKTVSGLTWTGIVSWQINDMRRANFRISRAVRAPNLDDTAAWGRQTGAGIDIPDPGLDPVEVTDYEIVMKAKTGGFNEELACYYMNFDNYIERAAGEWNGLTYDDADENTLYDNNERMYWQKVNIGDAYVWGVEHSMLGRYGKYLVRESITYTYGTNRGDGKPLSGIPPLRIQIGVGRALSRQTETEFIFRYAAKQDRLSPYEISDPRIPDGGTPGYSVFDLRFTYTINEKTTLNVVLENLADESYVEHGSWLWEAGRGISVGLTVKS